MVHPYLRRRSGKEKVEYPSEQLKKILHRTLGVPLFQEQAMKIAMDAANFTADEADELRRSMATFKAKGMVSKFEMKLIDGMVKNGYTEDFAKRVFRQLEGFGSYGFPESHAASFAHLAYVSAWLKCHYPDVFAAALLNSQPMGFYRPAQIIIDARKHGVEVRPVDVNFSYWDCTLEEKKGKYCALRLGFRQVKGLQRQDMEELIRHRLELRVPSLLHGDALSGLLPEAGNNHTSSGSTPLFYHTIEEVRQVIVSQAVLERMADADVFRSLGYDRREALWRLTTKDNPEALFKNQVIHELPVSLPLMTTGEHVIQDYASMSFSLKAHPVSFLREKLGLMHIVPAAQLAEFRDGAMVRVCGLVLVRQRPGTASGICFMTIEDETGVANIVFFQQLFDELRKIVTHSRLIMVEGKLQVEKGVIHVIAQKAYNFSSLLGHLNSLGQEPRKASLSHDPAAKDNSKVLPRSRDFR
jgi:error-prone DNA polymerase